MDNRHLRRLLLLTVCLRMLAVSPIAQTPPPAPDPEVTNEYRVTYLPAKVMSPKVILFGYFGFATSRDKNFTSLYYSPPNLIYKPKPWIELYAAMVGVLTNNKTAANSWELRPVVGAKFYAPNKWRWNIYSLSRYENRFIGQNHNVQSIPRFRNRFGFEAPLGRKKRAWTEKSFYTLIDVEPIWRFDTDILQVTRLRGGLGYIFSQKWRAEFIYHAELSGTNGDPTHHSGNIWRLNIKMNTPKRIKAKESPSFDD